MMTYRKKGLIKVIMEYNNGERQYIDGEDAKRWQGALDSAIVIAYIHGADVQDILKSIVWKKE